MVAVVLMSIGKELLFSSYEVALHCREAKAEEWVCRVFRSFLLNL